MLSVHGDVDKLIAGLRERHPELVFNLLEMFGQNMLGDVGVTGTDGSVGLCYTGCGPGEAYLQQDKALAKKLLAFDQIRYPDFAVFAADSTLETGGNLRMPLFVKPLRADASIGIDGGSLVHTSDRADEARGPHPRGAARLGAGRGVHRGARVLRGRAGQPASRSRCRRSRWIFRDCADGKPRIADAKAKWDEGRAEYKGTRSVLADIPTELAGQAATRRRSAPTGRCACATTAASISA